MLAITNKTVVHRVFRTSIDIVSFPPVKYLEAKCQDHIIRIIFTCLVKSASFFYYWDISSSLNVIKYSMMYAGNRKL